MVPSSLALLLFCVGAGRRAARTRDLAQDEQLGRATGPPLQDFCDSLVKERWKAHRVTRRSLTVAALSALFLCAEALYFSTSFAITIR